MSSLFLPTILGLSLYFLTEAKLLPSNQEPVPTTDESAFDGKTYEGEPNPFSKYKLDASGIEKRIREDIKKPCAIVVLSNAQNPNTHSLLRKYRYDAKGVLIPSSVKYYVKLPNGAQSSTVLVPLQDKAFSPLGGFVRYYKEVPPIPQAW